MLKIMLKKSFAVGVLAALAMAPVAQAGQTQANSSNMRITSGSLGTRNVSDIDSSTYTDQYQGKNSNRFCATRNQIQGNRENVSISNGNVGFGNDSSVSNSAFTRQRQNANCSFPDLR
ncbi:hypothetical protein DSM106972_021530 [Dulcicalothrix desertica PCC 7102]|jgi:hypothetical protein|uniref:Uncharacterized protein n=1 Tax=Dulcicalothrix desertica PCC 7102 TaxID=232991 RepID=A0A3S1CPI5_9CYAN|nr:hypothetical protein [Dulcicalothrix desertica]RUT07893.1 hypothetical protein DSM106972_021530 [Dulcicalothrix desertica PCC 7102]TWH39414.1 hypothetical protein CAL7102_08645 [Dulcicalothrix desertica PCC 7102]